MVRCTNNRWFVFHLSVLDPMSSCNCLSECLQEIKDWSDIHPAHHILFIIIELKLYGDFLRVGVLFQDHVFCFVLIFLRVLYMIVLLHRSFLHRARSPHASTYMRVGLTTTKNSTPDQEEQAPHWLSVTATQTSTKHCARASRNLCVPQKTIYPGGKPQAISVYCSEPPSRGSVLELPYCPYCVSKENAPHMLYFASV